MTGALKRLDEVRDDMRRLQQDLESQKRYFDSDDVARQVRERLNEAVRESGSNHDGPKKP